MRIFLAAAAALAVGVFAYAAEAQTAGTTTSRIRLVRAQCTTGPCAPQFDFKRGDVQIRRVKNPKPVADRRFGKISIVGLDTGLNPFPPFLAAQATGRQVFGSDPDGDCPLANTQSTGVFAEATSLACNVSAFNLGRCRGPLSFLTLLDARCTDVRRTIEDIRVEVYEGGFVGDPNRLIATNGVAILGKVPDCNSGGSGCP
jgi:hypothetical protein